VETPGSQVGFPPAAEEGGEVRGGGRWRDKGGAIEGGVQSKAESTASKA